ncbi:LGFP repeat-containing protein [Kineococcus sp. NUM-3379]
MISWKSRAAGLGAAVVVAITTATPAGADPRVSGDIGVAYERDYGGARGVLGEPLTPEVRTPGGRGAYVGFQHGSIYWSPRTDAHAVRGEIRDGYGRLDWENGYLGFPADRERPTPSRRGAVQQFEFGTMYWSPSAGAHALRGDIRKTYESFRDCTGGCVDGEGVLGFPTTSEIVTPGGRGAYTHFQRGSIYWSPGTGAHPIYGAIRDAWAGQGWEHGPLGFPLSEETNGHDAGTRFQQFEGGFVSWDPGRGATTDFHVSPSAR